MTHGGRLSPIFKVGHTNNYYLRRPGRVDVEVLHPRKDYPGTRVGALRHVPLSCLRFTKAAVVAPVLGSL